jgi:hypothetical protein
MAREIEFHQIPSPSFEVFPRVKVTIYNNWFSPPPCNSTSLNSQVVLKSELERGILFKDRNAEIIIIINTVERDGGIWSLIRSGRDECVWVGALWKNYFIWVKVHYAHLDLIFLHIRRMCKIFPSDFNRKYAFIKHLTFWNFAFYI